MRRSSTHCSDVRRAPLSARLFRNILKWTGGRFIPGQERSRAVPFVLRWGKARVSSLLRRPGLIRGTVIVWPQAGRAWAIGHDVPRPAGGQVLVRVAVSAISPGTERAFFVSLPHAAIQFPFFPGYSLAGEIVDTGNGVRQFRPGDRVALAAPHASLALASASDIYPVPRTVPVEEAAFIQLAIIALHGLEKAHPRPGHPLVVLGHGIIGQLLAQFASACGAYPVISVSRTAKRITDPLLRCVQRMIILERDGAQSLERLDSPITIEATGSPDAIPAAIRCTGEKGRLVLAGSTRGVTEKADMSLLARRAITIVGAHINSLPRAARRGLAQTFLGLLEHKRVDVASLISQRVHPWEAEWFYRRLAGRDDLTIGAVFSWDRLSSTERMRRVSLLTPPDFAPMQRTQMAQMPLAARLRQERSQATPP